jgi:hypothetical protein
MGSSSCLTHWVSEQSGVEFVSCTQLTFCQAHWISSQETHTMARWILSGVGCLLSSGTTHRCVLPQNPLCPWKPPRHTGGCTLSQLALWVINQPLDSETIMHHGRLRSWGLLTTPWASLGCPSPLGHPPPLGHLPPLGHQLLLGQHHLGRGLSGWHCQC